MPLHGRTFLALGALAGLGISTAVRTKGQKNQEASEHSVPEAIAADGRPVTFAAPSEMEPPPLPKSNGGRLRRRLGKIMIGLGIVLIGYSAAIVFWGDPVTYVYAHWKQHQLAGQLDKEFEAYAAALGVNSAVVERSCFRRLPALERRRGYRPRSPPTDQ